MNSLDQWGRNALSAISARYFDANPTDTGESTYQPQSYSNTYGQADMEDITISEYIDPSNMG